MAREKAASTSLRSRIALGRLQHASFNTLSVGQAADPQRRYRLDHPSGWMEMGKQLPRNVHQ
jgi:hypothetical protein